MVYLQGHLEVIVVEAKNLSSRNVINPYCIVELVGSKSTSEAGRTPFIDDHYNPRWLATIPAELDQDLVEIRFVVKDRSLFKDEKLGTCSLDANRLGSGTYTTTMELSSKKQANPGQLYVKLKFSGIIEEAKSMKKHSMRSEKGRGCVPRKVEEEALKETIFLHGNLEVAVKNAEDLPNLDSSLLNRKNKSDPFVVVALQDARGHLLKLARTTTIDDNLSPNWDESFLLPVCHDVANVIFIVYDEDVIIHDKMCSLEIPVIEIATGDTVSGSKPLFKNKTKESGKLTISLKFIKNVPQSSFVIPYCVFPSREENKVKLYQDASCHSLPLEIRTFGGRLHCPNNAWLDINETLAGAKKFICIAGWSLNSSIVLIRSEGGNGETIGRVLMEKAEAGVDVRVLLWDEAECSDAKKDTAKEFFKDSLVKVDLVSRKKCRKDVFHRDAGSSKSSFSHNQKCIIADESVEGSPGLRSVVAYVGCFDLTSNRYDTPQHKLCHNEDNEHKHQFYNSLIATITKSSSKVPWHEVLCKVIGSAAIDVYDNFQSRWEAEALVSESDLDLRKTEGLFLEYSYESLDNWDVQLLRSISEDSASLFDVKNVSAYGGVKFENSLHRAYIHQIQKAKKFIYIETSSFIGSSHFWEDCGDVHSKNLIPIEITTKIIEKINEKRSFTVYIVLSMHPESSSDDVVAQEMLHWQFHTIEMMYQRIGKAIKEKGLDAHPQDFLLFLCLGRREETDATPRLLKQFSEEGPLPSITKHKRMMIVVNSKLAIFDDEYLIIGSGDINDRALVGNRNTELAIGAYQPRIGAVGEVSTLRKSLWAEHLSENAPLDLEPSTLECSRRVRQLAEDSLRAYCDTTHQLPKCHLLLYPLQVARNGAVSARHDCEKFPDSKTHVLGARSKALASVLTT